MAKTTVKQKADTKLTEAQHVFKTEVQDVRERAKTNPIATTLLKNHVATST